VKDIVIIGHGGLAREVAQYISDIKKISNEWVIRGYSTANSDSLGVLVGGYNVCFLDDELMNYNAEIEAVIAIGFPQVIYKLAKDFSRASHISFPNLIHPHAYISDYVSVEKGNIVAPGVVLSVDIQIGSFNLFDWNVTIGHDCVLGGFNTFFPSSNISGAVKNWIPVMVGAGAKILPGLSVCDDVVIGAGAVVTKSIEESGTYIGVPAKRFTGDRINISKF